MPIRPDLRHLYRGPAWRAIRARILDRAGRACERCGKPHRTWCHVTRDGTGRWRREGYSRWRNSAGEPTPAPNTAVHRIRAIVTVAHLNHDPTDNRDENLAALCQWCHLAHDARFHHANARRTRARKAGQQWLTPELEAATRPAARPDSPPAPCSA